MKLAKLLELQGTQSYKEEISNVFGDSFLLKNNSIYFKIRVATKELGYIYSSVIDEEYLVLPLGFLEKILNSKVIPYYENSKVLYKIEKQIPHTIVWDQLTDHLKKNYLFHESCHAVSRSHYNQIFKTEKNQILALFLEEAFANSCELLGVKDVNDTAHKIFYEFSSYIYVYELKSLITQLIQELGFQTVFKITMLSYLHSLFLNDHFTELIYSEIFSFAFEDQLKPNIPTKKIKSLMKIVFELNPRFKTATTSFYLSYHHLKMPSEKYCTFEYMSELKNDRRYSEYINELVRVIH